jgi:hypothetical protein
MRQPTPLDTLWLAAVALRLPSPLGRSVIRISSGHLRASKALVALSLTLSANLFAQVPHVAVCRTASQPATSNDASLMSRFVSGLGDATTLASLKAIRYTTVISVGTGANPVKVEVTQTRVYPDRLILVTRIPGGAENYLEASPTGAFTQLSGGPRTNLPEAMRDELLKTVRLDRFYVGQNVIGRKVTVADTGTERIGDVDAAVLRINVEGAEVTWYVERADGRLLRSVAKVPVMGGMVDQVVEYSDWRNCDGLTVSFQRTITQVGKPSSEERVLAVELNPSMNALPSADSTIGASSGQRPSSLGGSAGGSWKIQPQKDKLTDRPSIVYLLNADGEKGYLALRCSGNGRFEEAWFDPGVVLDNSTTTTRGLLGGDQPFQMVQVRVESKIKLHSWFVSGDLRALTIGKRDLEEILNAKDYRVQFMVAFSGADVRKFSPSGIDRQLLKRTCGF